MGDWDVILRILLQRGAMRQLFAFLFVGMFAIFYSAGQVSVMAQSQVIYKSSAQGGLAKHSSRRAPRRYAPGPRRLNSEIYYRHTPRRHKKKQLSIHERRLKYKLFNGYFKQRLPHLERGYYSYKNWRDYYKKHYGYAQPYTPYFSHYFTPFNDGHFSGHFQR